MNAARILLVVGARPNYMKAAPVLAALRRGSLGVELVHTGQHHDPELSTLLMEELGMDPPEHRIEAPGGSALARIGAMLPRLEDVCARARPDLVAVFGDVDSTLAGALVANKLGIPLAHVEAGLRSFDDGMPEEWNRRATDLYASVCFCTEPAAVYALLAEGKPPGRIFLVGNGMIDTLLRLLPAARERRCAARLGLGERFALLTLHRPSNVDDAGRLRALLAGAVLPLSEDLPVVFPVHPRTRRHLDTLLLELGARRLVVTPPLGYLDFVSLMEEAALVLTDSGGVQEETTILGTPCLTVRDNTERPVTIERGTNRLVGTDPATVLRAARAACVAPRRSRSLRPPLWDGHAGERTAAILEAFLLGGLAEAASVARRCGARGAGQNPTPPSTSIVRELK
jgi:UDP-N-acetylglucosamine 2-epimerase (non-hydrolysing)